MELKKIIRDVSDEYKVQPDMVHNLFQRIICLLKKKPCSQDTEEEPLFEKNLKIF